MLLILNLIAANAAALTCVVAFLQPALVGIGVDGMPIFGSARVVVLPLSTGTAWAVFLSMFALLGANFLWLVRRQPSGPPRNYVLSETPTGPVRVAREALEAGLRAAGEALPEITRLRVNIDTSANKRVLVVGQFQCAEGVSNLQASQRLRAALRERLTAMVRPVDGTRVDYDLEFVGFQGKLSRKSGEGPPNLEPEPQPFTGPQYPIEEEEPSGGNS